MPSLPLRLQPCFYLDPRELVQGGLCSAQPLSQLVRAMLLLHLELSPEHHASEQGAGRGAGDPTAGSLCTKGRTSTPVVRLALPASCVIPTVSDAFLLKAETLSSEESL